MKLVVLEFLGANWQSWKLSQLLFVGDKALVSNAEETLCELVSKIGSV